MNVVAIYTAAKGRLPWTTEQLRPYVVHSYADPDKPDTWFFDTFYLLDFKVKKGSGNAALTTGNTSKYPVKQDPAPSPLSLPIPPAVQSDWLHLIESFFGESDVNVISNSTDSVLKRLDSCIAAAKTELGQPSFKHRVFLSVPEPITCFIGSDDKRYYAFLDSTNKFKYPWGQVGDNPIVFHRKLNDDGLSLSDSCDDCDNALKWYVDLCVSLWNRCGFQHLQLAGFQWSGEGEPGKYVAINTMKKLGVHIRTQYPELTLSVSFYYGPYRPIGAWNKTYREQCRGTFDYVFGQPNFSLGGDSSSRTMLDLYGVVNQAQQYVDGEEVVDEEGNQIIKTREGIVFEMDQACLVAADTGVLNPSRHCRVGCYLHALAGKNEMNVQYYLSDKLLSNAYDPDTNAAHGNYVFGDADYKLFDRIATFVRERRRAAAYARADINQNGAVGIEDMQIVTDVMTNSDTDPTHVARADVNRDGVVDLSDITAVQRVMLDQID